MDSSSEDDAESNYCTNKNLIFNSQKTYARKPSCIYILD